MNKKRVCYLVRIKEEMKPTYIKRHDEIPKELEKLYKDNGILQISCMLNGEFLVIFQEFDMDLYEKGQDIINESEVSKIFQKSLAGIDADVQIIDKDSAFEEVYRLE